MKSLTMTVRLSDCAQAYMIASIDLLRAVMEADDVLVTDEIREAAERLVDVIADSRGEL
jgi:hypothetical protein